MKRRAAGNMPRFPPRQSWNSNEVSRVLCKAHNRSAFFKLYVLICITVYCAACAAEEVSIDFWNGFTSRDGKYLQAIVNRFNEEQAGRIHVNMCVMPWADFYSKLSLALRSLRGPDVGLVHYDSMSTVIEQGIVLDMTPYLDRFPMDDYLPVARQISFKDGKQYGIPLDFHPFVFYWNKNIFEKIGLDPEKPPQSRAEFLDVCKKVKDAQLKVNGGIVRPCTMPTDWPNYLIWQSIFFCNGGHLFNETYDAARFDSEAGVDALQFMYDLIFKYGYSPTNTTGNEGMDQFKRGMAAMALDGVWMMATFKGTPGLRFGACSMINLGTKEHVVMTGSHTIVAFKKRWPDKRKIEASVVFMKYLSDLSLDLLNAHMIPARRSLIASEAFLSDPYMAPLARDVERYVFPDANYRYGEGVGELQRRLNLVILNKETPAEGLHEAADIATKALSQDPD